MNDSITSFVGIDVAKDSLDICILPEKTHYQVSYNEKGIKLLVSKLPDVGACLIIDVGACLIIVEATGRYEQRVVVELAAIGHFVSVANPRHVHHFGKAMGSLAKTDRIDAELIALYGQHVRPRTLAKHHEKQTELQQLETRRRQLIDLRTAENNRQELPTSKLVQKSIQKIIDMLQKQFKSIEKEIAKLLASDDIWKDKAEIIESIPGVGMVTVISLLSSLPKLGFSIARKYPHWLVWLLSIMTVVAIVESVLSGEEELQFVAICTWLLWLPDDVILS
ncbi:Transposase [Gimesia aquarii]|uniref:Transposase n=1 Tax=Gimesia aquarii TaxID=2527964 RepID=A0A517WWH2_9PLAN|nr:transposase [Gimesia aquarii]QDU09623.1 Transposase [Gimesia aquarii]